MTLIVTELSSAGVVMVADSLIKFRPVAGKETARPKHWPKIVSVPKVQAGLAYWGAIGKITPMQFDLWLRRQVEQINCNDVKGLAESLAERLNAACNNCALPEGDEVGIHVAGFQQWPDTERRPCVYHVHNGHAHIRWYDQFRHMTDGTVHSERVPKWIPDPRKLFEAHTDFPRSALSLEENLSMLEGGFILRNGDFYMYAVISELLNASFSFLNFVPGVSFPRNPSDLNSRRGLQRMMLEFIVKAYRSSMPDSTVGGDIHCLAIGPNGAIS